MLTTREKILFGVVLAMTGVGLAVGYAHMWGVKSKPCDETCDAVSQLPPVTHPLRGETQ
jgi:hypothetical protein